MKNNSLIKRYKKAGYILYIEMLKYGNDAWCWHLRCKRISWRFRKNYKQKKQEQLQQQSQEL